MYPRGYILVSPNSSVMKRTARCRLRWEGQVFLVFLRACRPLLVLTAAGMFLMAPLPPETDFCSEMLVWPFAGFAAVTFYSFCCEPELASSAERAYEERFFLGVCFFSTSFFVSFMTISPSSSSSSSTRRFLLVLRNLLTW